jgi:NAD(P)-dependent dehydrogenase (short-subunit alcohol dehydrogenase family)
MDPSRQGRFAGKVAVVTGSSANPSIGGSIACRLAAEGARVVINGRSKARLLQMEQRFQDEGFEVAAVEGSATDQAVVRSLVSCATERFGPLALVVSTIGGAGHNGPWEELTRDTFVETLALNTWPGLNLVQEAIRAGGLGAGGAVVQISSGSPNKTTPAMLSYAAGKAALNALTRTLARDLGPRGIRVNGVAPGLTRTMATKSMWEQDGGAGAARNNLVLGRLTDADDIANVATFLLSDEAAAVTGVVVDVDGGNHLISGGWSPFAPAPRT